MLNNNTWGHLKYMPTIELKIIFLKFNKYYLLSNDVYKQVFDIK